MDYITQLENRITRLENMIREESLESRVAKLENKIFEDDDGNQKSSKEYLLTLLGMLFKSKKVNPEGNKLDGNYKFNDGGKYPYIQVINMAAGDWEYNESKDCYDLKNENEIKKIVGAFCKIYKCLVDFRFTTGEITNDAVLHFELKKSPTLKVSAPKNYAKRWPRETDDNEWETLADQERRHNDLYHKRW